MQRLKPWLDVEDIVLEEMIKAMSSYCEKCELANKAKAVAATVVTPQLGTGSSWVPLAFAFCAISALALM